MIVGILEVKVVIRDARSLKDKRRVIKSLKDRIRNKFNVSIAEVGYHDLWQQALLGVSIVGTERRYCNSVLSKVVDSFRAFPPLELVDYSLDFV